jgi:hypothetical protein
MVWVERRAHGNIEKAKSAPEGWSWLRHGAPRLQQFASGDALDASAG